MLKYCISILFLLSIAQTTFAEESDFVLILGPSGTGKSTIIRHLKEMDSRFVYVTPLTTRSLRLGETDKIHVSLESMKELEKAGKLLVINQFYGNYYATPKYIIDDALEANNFPILDWPVEKMELMNQNYEGRLFTVYLQPESLEELQIRLSQDGRDKDGKRFEAGKMELEDFFAGKYDDFIDLKLINYSGKDKEVAELIYQELMNMSPVYKK